MWPEGRPFAGVEGQLGEGPPRDTGARHRLERVMALAAERWAFGRSDVNVGRIWRNPGDTPMAGLVGVGTRVERPPAEAHGGSRV